METCGSLKYSLLCTYQCLAQEESEGVGGIFARVIDIKGSGSFDNAS